jgi:tetratricopeptide (TPR) repeat protein
MKKHLKEVCMGVLLGAVLLLSAGCGRDEVRSTDVSDEIESTTQESIRSFWTYYREATRLRQKGDFEAARKAYRQALSEKSDHEDALYYLGNVDMELGAWKEAETSWKRLIEINPSSSRAFSQLGQLYLCRPDIALFDLGSARSSFERATDLNPVETGPVLRLGEIALLTGDPGRATTYFDAVTGSNNASTEAVLLKAYAESRLGLHEDALSDLNGALAAMGKLSDKSNPGEGDTRSGAAPALARGAGCPLFNPFLTAFEEAAVPVGRSLVKSQFASLDSLIADIAARNPR